MMCDMGYVQVVGLLLTMPLQILGNTASWYSNSPCPDALQYFMESEEFPYVIITAPAPLSDVDKIELRVVFSTIGMQGEERIELVEDWNEVERRINIKSKQPIKYRFNVSPLQSLPIILQMSLNGNIFCHNNMENVGFMQTFSTTHYPKNRGKDSIHFNETEECKKLLESSVTAKPDTENLPSDEECGIPTEEDEWPWSVAMFIKSESDGLNFTCGGTLLRKNIVLTAARCFQHNGGLLPLDLIVLHLGKFNLHDPMETNNQVRYVRRATLHKRLTNEDGTHDVDLGVMVLEEPVQYTRYVRPICLWRYPIDINQIVGQTGTVVGWSNNKNENKTDMPCKISMPIVPHLDCIDNGEKVEFPIINGKFYAGNKNGTGLCNVHRGSGFMIPRKENNITRWYLRGVVYAPLKDSNITACDLNLVIYIDTAIYMDWIEKFF